MNWYQLLLGQIPEALYFAIFMIFTKDLKDKRITFVILMVVEYLLLKYVFPFSVWFQISYTFMVYLLLKCLYKEKSQIVDIFTFTISSLILVIFSLIWIPVGLQNPILGLIGNRLCIIFLLIIFNKKLYNIQNMYKALWNRNNNPKKIKSTTFRSINVIIFNVLFYLINMLLTYELLIRR